MSIDKRWLLLIAVAAGGAAVALTSRHRQHRTARKLEHKSDLKSWENEGGNLAPAPVLAPAPAAAARL